MIQRTKEIGIRIALGAEAPNLTRMLISQSMKPVGLGLALGLVASLVVERFLASLLFNVSTMDLTVYFAVAIVLALSVLAAAFIPTVKAMRIDPVQTLKAQ